jgi:hypothetical protein
VGDATASAKGIIQLNDDFLATTARPGFRPETRLAVVNGTTAQTGLTSGTWTKVLFNNEDVDIGNCFASSTYTPDVAGWYRISAGVHIQSTTANEVRSSTIGIYKNGANVNTIGENSHGTTAYLTVHQPNGSAIVYANGSTDTFEIWARGITTGGSAWYIPAFSDTRYASFELIHKD